MHVSHVQDIDRVLEHGETVEVGVDDDVRDVAVHEELARRETDDLVRRHSAVRAADPQVPRGLLRGKARKVVGVALGDAPGPGPVACEQILEPAHRHGS